MLLAMRMESVFVYTFLRMVQTSSVIQHVVNPVNVPHVLEKNIFPMPWIQSSFDLLDKSLHLFFNASAFLLRFLSA